MAKAASDHPVILYIPGLKPKPEPEAHARELRRCLIEGVRRVDETVAAEIRELPAAFDLVSWTYDFYGEHRDIALDLPAIEDVLQQSGATALDRSEAASWQRRLLRWIYRVADHLPFLIPQVATPDMEIHLRDLRRYVRDENEMGEFTRRLLKVPLRAAAKAGRPVLLLAHSMGSVIAYDALWQLSHESGDTPEVDLFVSMGSPLGQNLIQRRLLGFGRDRASRYPVNITRWINIAAYGELTALDMTLANDFADMRDLGCVDSIEDYEIWNYFRMDGYLNVHAEYGYLVNEVTGRVIRDWWREKSREARG